MVFVVKDAQPSEIKPLKLVVERVNKVKVVRIESKRATTNKDAETPMLFGEIRQPTSDYLVLPEVSSENRKYIPIDYVSKEIIGSNKIYMVPIANKYHFGVLTSEMHMAWVKQICGRLKSDFQIFNRILFITTFLGQKIQQINK